MLLPADVVLCSVLLGVTFGEIFMESLTPLKETVVTLEAPVESEQIKTM